ncbi:MAG: carbohydrate ABC transporter permease [Ignavibacteriales bacterium]|nr:MAG: carbohydrate ABC transporter permease [Ignavibacteriales bacterium]
MKLKKLFFKSSKSFLLILYVIFLSFPLIWALSLSFKPTSEIYSVTPNIIPENPTAEHYNTVFSEQSIFQSMYNSLTVGVLSTIVVLIISLPAAYALARYKTFVNKIFLGWTLTSQIFPVIIIMVPLYIILRSLSLTDSILGLSLVYIVWSLPFVLWMLQGYIKGIPFELEEAAALDGASKSETIFKVIMPLLLPALGATALFSFISAWNEFFFALVLMKSQDLITLPVDLARFTGMEGQARMGPLAAASILSTIPSLILFGVIQKWFAEGLLSGAVKE